jgi:hypothetical protein
MRVYVQALVRFEVPDDWTPTQIAQVLGYTEIECTGVHPGGVVTVDRVEVPQIDHNSIMTDEHKTPCMTCGAWVPIGIDGVHAHVWGTYCPPCKL